MRDSWIDRKELEELVNSFPGGKKHRRRKPLPPVSTPPSEKGLAEKRLKEEASDIPEYGSTEFGIAEKDSSEPSTMTLAWEGEAVIGDERDVAADPARAELTAEPLPSETGTAPDDAEVAGGSTGIYEEWDDEMGESEISEGDSPPETGLAAEQGSEEMGALWVDRDGNAIVEGAPADESPQGLRSDLGCVSTVFVADDIDEAAASRVTPSFLDFQESLSEVPVPLPLEREADRAVMSLAEARARVDRGRLLRSRSAGALPEEETAAKHDVKDEGASESREDLFVSEIDEDIGQDDFQPSRRLRDRIDQFGDSAKLLLGATSVEVFDDTGLLLYGETETSEGRMAGVSLFEVSSRVAGMLGMRGHTATQVAAGPGDWLCLISGPGEASNLHAVFKIAEPLDASGLRNWQKALAEAVYPGGKFR